MVRGDIKGGIIAILEQFFDIAMMMILLEQVF